ncbi:16S rRNA (guanine(966)-N(2))-methyltransferase RsmD [Pedobacter yulinensis]|uniref:16S rRNA (Guanine(966)-N(2))-methyltransferase RsmD n=1 Tax=Pedobacter yulinensis TaxID=2126353 RepID=A0A2T3HJN6_9SPHI|nr:RsmD family RNA methyltransferase [Pedobacter yulinensis]PST82650.1 16S rRNA (guanine(966)-N(2))-methyltransferase RsmD [Pedobacter yulinensis]
MRIIGGRLKGVRLQPPANLPVRPTTDMAKEALFNILNNSFDLDQVRVLDLFCGTGNVSLEFASRGAEAVTAVDQHMGCVKWVKDTAAKHNLDNIAVRRADVFKLLLEQQAPFDLIFADPPYQLPSIPQIPALVHAQGLLRPGGWLIVEHQSMMQLSNQPAYAETRKYGNSSFSFFKNP